MKNLYFLLTWQNQQKRINELRQTMHPSLTGRIAIVHKSVTVAGLLPFRVKPVKPRLQSGAASVHPDKPRDETP
jgi:hypothetical protein